MSQEQPKPATILVVDDDDDVRQVLRLMLETGGYEVVEAANGRQALGEVRQRHVDLVITDLIMPEQEGIETIQTIRRERPELKIIAMSGAFGGDLLRLAKLVGAHSTMQKPLHLELVLEAVRDALHA